MRNLFCSVLLLFVLFGVSLAQQQQSGSEEFIIAGKGRGVLAIGSSRKDVESLIGKGQERSSYDDVYFLDYPTKGLQVSYTNDTDEVSAIFFYNKQKRYEHFDTLEVRTDKGISWTSTPDEVIRAYGKPENHYKDDSGGNDWQRIVFDGIDFRFENNKLVRIGIPAR